MRAETNTLSTSMTPIRSGIFTDSQANRASNGVHPVTASPLETTSNRTSEIMRNVNLIQALGLGAEV